MRNRHSAGFDKALPRAIAAAPGLGWSFDVLRSIPDIGTATAPGPPAAMPELGIVGRCQVCAGRAERRCVANMSTLVATRCNPSLAA